jgi:hypothetical protein
MSRELGRPGYGGDLPSHKPVEVILAVLMAVVGTGVILLYQYEREWSFVRRLYLPTYPRDGPGSNGAAHGLLHIPGGGRSQDRPPLGGKGRGSTGEVTERSARTRPYPMGGQARSGAPGVAARELQQRLPVRDDPSLGLPQTRRGGIW